MILYPAIDLKDGKCVRLLKGDMNKSMVFTNKPSDQAEVFQESGCKWLHLVDLNGAIAGESMNMNAVQDILKVCKVPIQLGGGIRDMGAIRYWLKTGISRIILGTVAVEQPDLVRAATRAFPGKIAIAIDALKGYVATEGWVKKTNILATELAKRYEDEGVAAIIYTDIDKDGMMQGPNIRTTKHIAESVRIPVIASGGVSKLEDLWALRGCGAPLNGVICGRALYDKELDIKEALEAVKPL